MRFPIVRATIALTVTVVTAPIEAQQPMRYGSHVSVAGGLTYSTLGGQFIEQASWKPGFFVGARVMRAVTPNFGVGVEANYFQTGASNIVAVTNDQIDEIRFSYIEIPLIFNYFNQFGSNWVWGAYTGFGMAFTVSCDIQAPRVTNPDCKGNDAQQVVQASDLQLNVPFGLSLGYVFPGSSTVLMADVRFSLGLNSALSVVAARNRSLQFMLRLLFG